MTDARFSTFSHVAWQTACDTRFLPARWKVMCIILSFIPLINTSLLPPFSQHTHPPMQTFTLVYANYMCCSHLLLFPHAPSLHLSYIHLFTWAPLTNASQTLQRWLSLSVSLILKADPTPHPPTPRHLFTPSSAAGWNLPPTFQYLSRGFVFVTGQVMERFVA